MNRPARVMNMSGIGHIAPMDGNAAGHAVSAPKAPHPALKQMAHCHGS